MYIVFFCDRGDGGIIIKLTSPLVYVAGDELVYLDPHTTQPVVDLVDPNVTDDSYHCLHSSRMKILDLDPSIALVSLFLWSELSCNCYILTVYTVTIGCTAEMAKDSQLLLVYKNILFVSFCETLNIFTGPTHFLSVMA